MSLVWFLVWEGTTLFRSTPARKKLAAGALLGREDGKRKEMDQGRVGASVPADAEVKVAVGDGCRRSRAGLVNC